MSEKEKIKRTMREISDRIPSMGGAQTDKAEEQLRKLQEKLDQLEKKENSRSR